MGLFKPAWMGNNEEKALKAVAKINDQAKLVKIVKETKLWRVKVAVVEKLNK